MNHGYAHVWFGGKAGLIDAACKVQAERLRDEESGTASSVSALQSPQLVLMFRLLGRLQNEPGGIELARQRERPMMELVTAQIEDVTGVGVDDARVLATLSVAAAAGIATVGGVLQFDVAALVDNWPRVTSSFR